MQYAGLALDELKHVRQAVGFLVCESYSFIFRYLMLFLGGGGDGAIGCDFEYLYGCQFLLVMTEFPAYFICLHEIK